MKNAVAEARESQESNDRGNDITVTESEERAIRSARDTIEAINNKLMARRSTNEARGTP